MPASICAECGVAVPAGAAGARKHEKSRVHRAAHAGGACATPRAALTVVRGTGEAGIPRRGPRGTGVFLCTRGAGITSGRVEWDVDDFLEWGCARWKRAPNVELFGARGGAAGEERVGRASGVAEGGLGVRELLDGAERWWASFDGEGDVVHPDWFKAGAGYVPAYSNVLVTRGGDVGIGMHVDTVDVGDEKVLVDTYLSLVKGEKRVVMVPPGVRGFGAVWLGGESGCEEVRDELRVLREKLFKAGGFAFILREGQTLYIPRGWQHWLRAEPPSTVTITGSRF